MPQTITLTAEINTQIDLQAIVGMYIGLLSSKSTQSDVLTKLANQLESQLKQHYTPEQWQGLTKELSQYVEQTQKIASQNFDDFKLG